VPPIEMTARYCGMSFLEPFVVHDPDSMSDAALMARANELRALLQPNVAPA
jgi:putative NADPH-quinone reductase